MNKDTFIAIMKGDPTRLALGILKRYTTKTAMIADIAPTYELNGVTYEIEFGNLVSVSGDGVYNGLYRRIKDGWEYIGSGDINGELETKLEPETLETQEAGHIAIKTNADGNLYADFSVATHRQIISFLEGLKLGNFQSGVSGGQITGDGDGELKSLKLREFLETPELRKNRITVNGNESWFTDSCVVKAVTRIGISSEYIITPKLEEGELISFRSSDIVRGIFNYDTGFTTSIMQVITVNDESSSMIVMPLNGQPPVPFMVLARQSNAADTDRQGSIYADALNKFIRVLNGYDPQNPSSIGDIDQIKVQMGNLAGINHPVFGALSGYGLYGQNVYITGRFLQSSWDGTEFQVPGFWRKGFDQDVVYYPGDLVRWFKPLWGESTFRCIKQTTIITPRILPSNEEYWELHIPAGQPAYTAEIHSTKGTSFLNGDVDTTLHAILKMGGDDVTASIDDDAIVWSRVTDDTVSDTVWNAAHVTSGKYVNITMSDLINRKAIFNVEFNL